MPYSESITIRTRDCDMSGHWKPSSIMETALDGNSFSFLGFTREDKRCFAIRGTLATTEG